MVGVRPGHIEDLLANVRTPDVAEFWAAGHVTPQQAVHLSLKHSREAWAGVAGNGQLLCLFGIAGGSLLSNRGTVWMIGHSRLDRFARPFLRDCGAQVQAMLGRYEHLSNWVDARNTRAIRWLRWLGFEIHAAAPHGADGLPFHYFEMSHAHV